jgi:hypothetical protein
VGRRGSRREEGGDGDRNRGLISIIVSSSSSGERGREWIEEGSPVVW